MRQAEGSVVHRHHPSRFQIEEGAGGVGGAGMDTTKRRRVIGADRKQSQFRCQAPANLAKSGKIRGVAGVIDRVLRIAQHVAAVAAMRILEDSSAPMPRGHVGHGQPAMPVAVPPVQFDHVVKAQIGNQIENLIGNHDDGRSAAPATSVLHDGSQRWAVQVIKVRMRHQHQINRGEVAQSHSRLPKPLQHKQPAGKIGVNEDVLAADLHEKAGVPDKGDA